MLYENLNHLSDDEIDTLMKRYYNGENVAGLIEEYQLLVRTFELFTLFPPIKIGDSTCPYCGKHLVQNRLSKLSAKRGYKRQDMYCPTCLHQPYIRNCQCINCRGREKAKKERRIQQIRDVYSSEIPAVDFEDLSFDTKVYIGALCRACCAEDLSTIKPYIKCESILAPTEKLCNEIYQHLLHDHVITVSPSSPIEAFALDESFPNKVHFLRATYRLNLTLPENKDTLFEQILNPSYYAPNYREDALALWKKISIAECTEYLMYQLGNVGFDFSPGAKTHKVFEMLLNDFSVAQVYSIIWRAVASASKLYLEQGLSRQYAANSVVAACERIGDRARLNGWNLSQYQRPKDLPQSALSAFFFDRVMGIGDFGFTSPPQII